MAVKHGGTTSTTALTGVTFSEDSTLLLPADLATVSELIKTAPNVIGPNLGNAQTVYGAFVREGRLVVPGRGALIIMPGDGVMVDPATGWPILVSGYAIANGPWHFA